jgi:hypothetical protein
MTLATHEFIRRFLMHVLPKGFHRIRYYGFFANGNRAANIARARDLLAVAALGQSDAKASGSPDEPRILAYPWLPRPDDHHRGLRKRLRTEAPAEPGGHRQLMTMRARLPHETTALESRSPGGHADTCAKPLKTTSLGEHSALAATMTGQRHGNRRNTPRRSQPFRRPCLTSLSAPILNPHKAR